MAKVISFIGDAECPHCRIPLLLYRDRSSQFILDKDGTIIEEADYIDDIYLNCEKCGRTFETLQHGNKFIVYTDLRQKLDIYNMIENCHTINKSPFVKGDN